jgi:alpha-1,2-mannosyltransferase
MSGMRSERVVNDDGSVRLALPVSLVALLAGALGWSAVGFTTFHRADGFFHRSDAVPLLVLSGTAWGLFGLAAMALRSVPERLVAPLVLGGGLLIGVAALLGDPNTSTDSARYAWDGIVQRAGVSPYAHTPVDPALAALRPDWLFPAAVPGADGMPRCTGERIGATAEAGTGDLLCTGINRPTVPTIYPPVAELWFLVVRLFVPAGVTYLPFQVAGLVVVLAVTLLLLVGLKVRGLDPRLAALWAWCPLVATEAVTNSHVDVVGAALALLATLLISRGRRIWGGVALGAAIAAKLVPAIVVPPLLTRRPLTVIVIAVGTFAAAYVPYVLVTGWKVIGYLPGYLSEEGYADGSRFALLPPVVPAPLAVALVAAVLALAAALSFWHADPAAPWRAQVALVGTTLLAVSPSYAWYGLLLVPFIALSARPEWFAVAFALTIRLYAAPAWLWSLSLAAAAIVVVVVSIRRSGPAAALDRIRHPFRRAPRIPATAAPRLAP